MNDNSIWNIIARHLAGEGNSYEETVLAEWLNRDKLNRSIFERLVEIWNHNPDRLSRSESIYKVFRNKIENYSVKREKNSFSLHFLRIAASVLLITGAIALLYTILPYNKTDSLAYHEVSVPRGSRTYIILPDSSKIWISNNSKIKYPDQFTNKEREVDLAGEAYFEVTPNPDIPFIVNIGSDRIKVLGTKFSVSAYPEDGIIRTDLLEGRIQLDINQRKGSDSFKSYKMKPSQSLVYEKASGKFTASVTPEGFFDYWENGIYSFQNESLENLAQRIYRIYNVQIVFEDDFLKSKRFSGNLSTDDNIFTFMEAIKRTSLDPIDYRYENKSIYIKLKQR